VPCLLHADPAAGISAADVQELFYLLLIHSSRIMLLRAKGSPGFTSWASCEVA